MLASDPVALIEDAYRPQPSPEAWLRAMGRDIGAPFDTDGLGVASYFVGERGPENLSWTPGAGRHIELEDATDLVAGAYEQGTPEQLAAFERALQVPGVSTLAEHIGSLPPRGRNLVGIELVDSTGIVINTGEGRVAVICCVHPRTPRIDEATRALWARIAVHLGAGCRLAGRDPSPDAGDVEIVATPEGKVVDASGDGKAASSRERVRDAAAALDKARCREGRRDPYAALELWQGLVAGRWSLVDHFDRDGRRFLLARRNDPDVPQPRGLSYRQRQVVFYASLGWSLKEIGYALGLSEATVSGHVAAALRKLGLGSRADLVRLGAELIAGVRDAVR